MSTSATTPTNILNPNGQFTGFPDYIMNGPRIVNVKRVDHAVPEGFAVPSWIDAWTNMRQEEYWSDILNCVEGKGEADLAGFSPYHNMNRYDAAGFGSLLAWIPVGQWGEHTVFVCMDKSSVFYGNVALMTSDQYGQCSYYDLRVDWREYFFTDYSARYSDGDEGDETTANGAVCSESV